MSVEAAGTALRQLLSEPGPVRRLWVARAGGRQLDVVNISAVAQVLADYLWDEGLRPETDTELPRRLKDRVRRALSGQSLTVETIGWFSSAFGFTTADTRNLEHLLAGSPSARAITGEASAPALPVARRYRTVSLHEHHYLGPDRCPALHRTTQVLEGTEDSLENYLYMFDTNTIQVEVSQGGEVTSPIKSVAPGVYGVEIALTRPLRRGETATLTYESRFSYTEPPEPEFRRAAFYGVESVDIRVEFHPDAVPVGAWFAEWSGLDDHEPSMQRIVDIERDLSVHQFLRTVENCIVGFRWQWG